MLKTPVAGYVIGCLVSFAGLAVAEDSAPKVNPLAQMRADHIMISTDDYRATLDWYNRVLGFEVVREWDIEGYPDVDVGYIAANGFMIEVVGTKQAFQKESVAPDIFTAMSDRGYVHMAFNSADVDAVAAELVSRGVELELPPTNFDAAGVRLLFIRDNNGNLIEIVTPLSAYK
ncbi:MAG: VOC family protein [Porticoccaceae bacterium]|jgi:methylmalonyl-CoA/ethylmalonyl-CoA epimerase|nr:VOC family protein [Porticoccaceae bacterium]MDG1448003.1 VOC family protein [Porticoccaceae bacterium]